MCGIAGIVGPQVRGFGKNIHQMIQAIQHRGPDGSGAYLFERCALGHTRLSIVDLQTGSQPMIHPELNLGITFNGEIYGYKSIKEELSQYPFKTKSDTEVILALYSEYGENLFKHLPGMFAFALWDDKAQALLCGRDRFGEKPFYYAVGKNGEFVFASEIKAILASGMIDPIMDINAVAHYLKYLYVNSKETIYKNIFTLPPAHYLLYRNGTITIQKYWELPKTLETISLSQATEQFQNLLSKAVSKQLVADVPVGAFLSGGLDSSTIVALASEHQTKLKTFSFGFVDQINELPFAKEVAETYHTQHTELTDTTANLAEVLVLMQQVYDEPFADSSNIPTFLISKLARQHVKVALSGDAGDELLGGYDWYKPLYHMNPSLKKYADFSSILMFIYKVFYKTGLPLSKITQNKILGISNLKNFHSVQSAHLNQRQYFNPSQLSLFGLQLASGEIVDEKRYGSNSVDDAMRMDIEDYMPGDILTKVDRASMAHGLELRAPFLDVDFASFCISLPYSLKISSEEDKLIMRRAFSHRWPESVRARGKQGFGAPVQAWLKNDSFKILKQEYLFNANKKIFSLLSYKATRSIVETDTYYTWILLVLSIWMESHKFDLS